MTGVIGCFSKSNGKPILVRGGGWGARTCFSGPRLEREQLRGKSGYVKDMKPECDFALKARPSGGRLFLELLATAKAIMVIAGWLLLRFLGALGANGRTDDYDTRPPGRWRDQIRRIRNHPCGHHLLVWQRQSAETRARGKAITPSRCSRNSNWGRNSAPIFRPAAKTAPRWERADGN